MRTAPSPAIDKILAPLDPDQREAVLHSGKPLLCLSPAGTGKTTVAAARIACKLANGEARPDQILAITFTNEAAATLRNRIQSCLAHTELGTGADAIWIGTFHAACARILRNHPEAAGVRPGFQILDEIDSASVLKRLLRAFAPELAALPDELDRASRRVAPLLRQYRTLDTLPEYTGSRTGPSPENVLHLAPHDHAVLEAYENELAALNSLDYDALITRTIALLRRNPEIRQAWQSKFLAVEVDEFQDCSPDQLTLLKLLIADPRRLTAIGDDDQQIYGWRDADVRCILEFEKDWGPAKVITLRRNYRSHPAIIKAAARLIAHNTRRRPKSFIPAVADNRDYTPIVHESFNTDLAETAWIARKIQQLLSAGHRPRDFAVLIRTNRMADLIADALHAESIPLVLAGAASLHQRPDVKLALAWLKITEDPAAELPFERIATSEPFLVLRTAIDHLSSLARKRSIPTRAAAIAYAPSLGLPAADLEQLAKLEAAIELHTTTAPPAARLAALLADPILSPGWSAAAQAGRDSGDNDLAELASRITPYQTIDDYLAAAHFEATDKAILTANGELDRVRIMSIHAAKGTQAAIVFLPGWEEDNFPIRNYNDHGTGILEEERRRRRRRHVHRRTAATTSDTLSRWICLKRSKRSSRMRESEKTRFHAHRRDPCTFRRFLPTERRRDTTATASISISAFESLSPASTVELASGIPSNISRLTSFMPT